jgi:hypothetical protein
MQSHRPPLRWQIETPLFESFTDWCKDSPNAYATEDINHKIGELERQGQPDRSTVENALNQYKHLQRVWKSQCSWVVDQDGRLLVDYVGRYEYLADDFLSLCRRIGLKAKLPFMNTTAHSHYRKYYTEETRRIVEKRFEREIQMFGYEF